MTPGLNNTKNHSMAILFIILLSEILALNIFAEIFRLKDTAIFIFIFFIIAGTTASIFVWNIGSYFKNRSLTICRLLHIFSVWFYICGLAISIVNLLYSL